jgi:hypothetical protein
VAFVGLKEGATEVVVDVGTGATGDSLELGQGEPAKVGTGKGVNSLIL